MTRPNTSDNSKRHIFVSLFFIMLAITLWSFRETLLSMFHIWYTSEDFQHGMLIIPISVYLIWRKRTELLATEFNINIYGIIIIFLFCILWIAGDVGGVQILKHIAFFGLVLSLVFTCLGYPVFRVLVFPLGYLLLAIPTQGPFVYPLQQVTAEFVYHGLELSGIPFYREGQLIYIPAGTFEVAEACSGIRFLTSTFTLSILYVYLTYSSYKKRFIFLAFAIIIPIIANGIRAFLTVLAGHYISMEVAGGADHIIFGWQFFGIIMFLMFWIGSRWSDNQSHEIKK